MKKTFLLLIMIFFVYTSNKSQVLISLIFGDKLNSNGVEFGITGGENFGLITGMELQDYYKDWNLGFYFNLRIKEGPWFVYTGVLVKSKLGTYLSKNEVVKLGVDTFSLDGTYAQKSSTFIVPVFLKYRFKNRIHFEAGPQFGLVYKANVEYKYENAGNSALIIQKNRDLLNRIDAGIGIGMGYRFNDKATGASIGLKYYYGFVNVYKGISGTKNSTIFLQLDIPFGASDCAQKKKQENALKKQNK